MLPNGAATSLLASLTIVTAFLTDANANNDSGACAQRASLIKEGGYDGVRGDLAASEAVAIRDAVEAVMMQADC